MVIYTPNTEILGSENRLLLSWCLQVSSQVSQAVEDMAIHILDTQIHVLSSECNSSHILDKPKHYFKVLLI